MVNTMIVRSFLFVVLLISQQFDAGSSFNVVPGVQVPCKVFMSSCLPTSAASLSTKLKMGLFDFFTSRENDFIKLESTSTYGPGPILILYNVPSGILDEEIQDMIDDGMMSSELSSSSSTTTSKVMKVNFIRINPSDLESIGQMTVKDVLKNIQQPKNGNSSIDTNTGTNTSLFETIYNNNNQSKSSPTITPILYFSGISNEQMMKIYNIIAQEIYYESDGVLNAACAKVVEPAMEKCFSQLIEEISGDHADATQSKD